MSVNGTCGQNKCLFYGVSQGSLLRPLFYILYAKDLEKIAAKHGLSVQMYADDTQIYTRFTSENVCQTKIKIENCLSEINNWMCQNYLKINQNKTEVIVFHPSTKVSIALVQWFPNCAPRDFVRGAAKAGKSCCTYCFSHNNCSVKVVSSNVPSKSFLSVHRIKAV